MNFILGGLIYSCMNTINVLHPNLIHKTKGLKLHQGWGQNFEKISYPTLPSLWKIWGGFVTSPNSVSLCGIAYECI